MAVLDAQRTKPCNKQVKALHAGEGRQFREPHGHKILTAISGPGDCGCRMWSSNAIHTHAKDSSCFGWWYFASAVVMTPSTLHHSVFGLWRRVRISYTTVDCMNHLSMLETIRTSLQSIVTNPAIYCNSWRVQPFPTPPMSYSLETQPIGLFCLHSTEFLCIRSRMPRVMVEQ